MRRYTIPLLALALLSLGGIGTAVADHQLNCVGNPPRQTEDPLSPSCGPYEGGDNGGSTDQGVTADSIMIVFYNDLGITGDLNEPWVPEDESAGHQADQQQRDLIRTVKAHIRHFVSSFESYGRDVRVIAKRSMGGLSTPCSGRQGDAAKAQLDLAPFATIAMGGAEMTCYAEYMASRFDRPTFLYGGSVSAALQRRYPGLIWSFMPGLEEQARASASFICRKLDGRPARFTSDPLLQGRPRKFGVIYPSVSQRGTFMKDAAAALLKALKSRCDPGVSVETFVEAGTAEAPNIMNKWKRANITTVICFCVPVPSESAVTKFQTVATALTYFPEWFWDSTAGMDKAMWHQLFGSKQQISFGVSHFWRQAALRHQHHYQAYLSQEPDSVPNTRFSWTIYHALLQGFTAIQVAGPTLTAANVATGMRAHDVSSLDPFKPTASYTSSDSFVESFTGWWWDPSGTPPDGRANEGCMRMLAQGTGFAPGTWTTGDNDLFTPDAPCGAANQTAYP